MLVLILARASAVARGKWSCSECSAVQEVIHRSIARNISAYEARALAGTATAETIQVGMLIWGVCRSKAWKEQEQTERLEVACAELVLDHVKMMKEYWQSKTTEEYKDPALALRMVRAVCTDPRLATVTSSLDRASTPCSMEDLPDDDKPLTAWAHGEECELCEAVVADMHRVIERSRNRPTSGTGDAYARLRVRLAAVCEDLPMRHAIQPRDRHRILEACEDFWEDHESALVERAWRHKDGESAQKVCSTLSHKSPLGVFEVCEPAAKDDDEL